jgi:hypothetical protein
VWAELRRPQWSCFSSLALSEAFHSSWGQRPCLGAACAEDTVLGEETKCRELLGLRIGKEVLEAGVPRNQPRQLGVYLGRQGARVMLAGWLTASSVGRAWAPGPDAQHSANNK